MYIVSMNKPAGMSVKEFKSVVAEVEKIRTMLSYGEKQKCQEVLKLAGIKKHFHKCSLNFAVKSFLHELTPLARDAVELHMKIGALPIFLSMVLNDELWTSSQKEIA